MTIRILNDDVISKISAGEVIERPSAVLKELIENSIDAGAQNIQIDIHGAGRQLMRITDDGIGMNRSDAKICLQRHSTSKIQNADDLNQIDSFGFRGEALYSIQAVSRFKLTTSMHQDTIGTEVSSQGGKNLEIKDAPPVKGTIIEVRDLFFNTPARLKFLKSARSEKKTMIDMISSEALAFPEVSFSVYENDKQILKLNSRETLSERISDLYGKDLIRQMIPVTFQEAEINLRGYISKPVLSRSDRGMQLFFVNNRFVKSLSLQYGLQNAYRTRLMVDRHPISFLFLDINPKKVDVNVHPTKKEVRFEDSTGVQSLMTKVIRQTLEQIRNPVTTINMEQTKLPSYAKNSGFRSTPRVMEEVLNMAKESSSKFIKEPSLLLMDGQNLEEDFHEDEIRESELIQGSDDNRRVLGSVCGVFIIIETSRGLGIIDQHAAHERVLYERFHQRAMQESIVQQDLLIPLEFNPSASEKIILENSMHDLRALGFSIEPFGDQAYILNSIPNLIDGCRLRNLIHDIIRELSEGQKQSESLNQLAQEKIIRASCRSAVMANDQLSIVEMEKLIEDLYQCDVPQSCPHGRPVFLEWSKEDLEKIFGRLGSH